MTTFLAYLTALQDAGAVLFAKDKGGNLCEVNARKWEVL